MDIKLQRMISFYAVWLRSISSAQ